MKNNCPPQLAPTRFDLRSTADCAATLQELLQAYANAVAGSRRSLVRFNERWTEYAKPNAAELRQLYITLYSQCPAAARAGLPDLSRSGPISNADIRANARAVRAGPYVPSGASYGRY